MTEAHPGSDLPDSAPVEYRRLRIAGGDVIARADVLPYVHDAILTSGSLYAFAADHPQSETIQGRARLYIVPGPGADRWVVRKLTHGGALAPLTGDRFLRLGLPRPFNELRISLALQAAGIPTPEVAAAVTYASGPIYRGEVARAEIGDAADLAACLFEPPELDRDRRRAVLAEAGRLIATLHRAGIVHPDLNLRNLLIAESSGDPRAYVLDVEKCRRARRVSPAARNRMLRRLRRSARRFEARGGARISEEEWRAFQSGYESRWQGGL
ncbi:MAG: phosphotransferase [Gemmatimonadota bacterium]|nr:MAG: phosphotransferase [Gemmatimonadota bacterium]